MELMIRKTYQEFLREVEKREAERSEEQDIIDERRADEAKQKAAAKLAKQDKAKLRAQPDDIPNTTRCVYHIRLLFAARPPHTHGRELYSSSKKGGGENKRGHGDRKTCWDEPTLAFGTARDDDRKAKWTVDRKKESDDERGKSAKVTDGERLAR